MYWPLIPVESESQSGEGSGISIFLKIPITQDILMHSQEPLNLVYQPQEVSS